jgi:hypothetical protein
MIRFTEIPFVGVTVEWYTGGAAWRLERFRWLVSGRQCGMRCADRPTGRTLRGWRDCGWRVPRCREDAGSVPTRGTAGLLDWCGPPGGGAADYLAVRAVYAGVAPRSTDIFDCAAVPSSGCSETSR